jgi:hypothetical protein
MPDPILDYEPPKNNRKTGAFRYAFATIAAVTVCLIIFFIVGETVVEKLALDEKGGVFFVLIIADLAISVTLAVLALYAVIEEPKELE